MDPGVQVPRFTVGQRVMCKSGAEEWTPGVVVQLHYQESDMPAAAPYQVQLISGSLIYVPIDSDQLCRKLEQVWWATFFDGRRLVESETATLERLLMEGHPADLQDHFGDTLLLAALRKKWLGGARAALAAGADPNLGSLTFVRPLHNALRVGREAVLLLLEARADPNLQDMDPDKDPDAASATFEERDWHRTALHHAATRSAELCGLLLDHGADPRALDAHYRQPLHLAAEARQLDVVDLLLARGADPDAGHAGIGLNNTPLIDAVYRNDAELVLRLVRGGADINRQGKQGMTALHVAARGRRTELASLLLAMGADPSIKSSTGKTAAELASLNEAPELAARVGQHRSQCCECPTTCKADEATSGSLCID